MTATRGVPALPVDHVLDALRQVQHLHRTTLARVESVFLDGVQWRPFCSRWTCSCAVPDEQPCEEWMGLLAEPGDARRCPRCGWPEHRHPIRFGITRTPRQPDRDDDPCPWRVVCSASRCTEPWWLPTHAAAVKSASRHAARWHP